MQRKIIVLGASENVDRYSNMAVKKLAAKKYNIIAVGNKIGKIENIKIVEELLPTHGVDTITLYLNAQNQKKYYRNIIAINPLRIIFNPGAENVELEELAYKNGIKTLHACTLVLLSTNQF
ncbi:MAG: CoA-binding protein [Ferruginibacter sp.]|nr:CoA-binding protein [Ferruginibacter sp.]